MGSILRDRRQELGREIESIARETRINASYLRAIEEEDYSLLPVEVYAKAYIREYARFLGVPADSVLPPYERYIAEKKRSQKTVALPSVMKKDSTSRPERGEPHSVKPDPSGARKNLRKALCAVPFIAAAIALYTTFPSDRDAGSLPVFTPPVHVAAETKTETDRSKGFSSPIPSEAGAAVSKGHTLEITATDKVWIQVVMDGSEKKEALMNPGEKVSCQASDSFRIIIGNASGVKILFDGKEMGSLGDKANVLRLTLPETATQLSAAVPASTQQ